MSTTEMVIGGVVLLGVGYLLLKPKTTVPTTVYTTAPSTVYTNPAAAQAASTTAIANDSASVLNNLLNSIFS